MYPDDNSMFSQQDPTAAAYGLQMGDEDQQRQQQGPAMAQGQQGQQQPGIRPWWQTALLQSLGNGHFGGNMMNAYANRNPQPVQPVITPPNPNNQPQQQGGGGTGIGKSLMSMFL